LPSLARLAAPTIAALALLSACGGSSNGGAVGTAASTSPAGAEAATPPATAQAGGDQAGATTRRHTRSHSGAGKAGHAGATGSKSKGAAARSGPDPVTRSNRPARAIGTKGESHSEVRSTGPLGVNPCTLVKRSEAAAIVGMAIGKPQLGLQGPTCIYQAQRIKQPITVALQRLSLPAVMRLGRNVVHTDVGGRKAVCMNYGGLKLLVPVSTGSVLTVGAPCPLAQHLAATALRRLR
jgi:hypothetical protein